MSREIALDFSNLQQFIAQYNIQELTTNSAFTQILSQQHKKYFAYLTFIAELTLLAEQNKLEPQVTKQQINFLTESCSDVGTSIFVMTHGAYKAARLTLRSSIENFNKGFNLDTIKDIDQVKSVYAIFDSIKASDFFNDPMNLDMFNSIHQNYKILCEDVHTATDLNMKQITALKYFPTFEFSEASKFSKLLMVLVSSYNSLLAIKYNNHFHQMHHRNKENIAESIPKNIRRRIMGIVD